VIRKLKLNLLFICSLPCWISCNDKGRTEKLPLVKKDPETIDTVNYQNSESPTSPDTIPESDLEKRIIEYGLVNVQSLDSTIRVDLKYSSCDNFLFTDMYGDLNKAYLQKEVAEKLVSAQVYLKNNFPYYSLIIYDAVRPRSIQTKMWDTLKLPFSIRTKYVSNPQNGSLHNFGAAVDLSIIDENGIELDMGTPYDYFGELAYPREEERMIKENKLSYKQLLNRKILRDAMIHAGFMDITTEWWHFNSCYRIQAAEKYKIIE
jgi:zinc D-Ala-D-Ala dipeptidase